MTDEGQAPDVSVIIGAYNAMPYLIECVDSVLRQSIGTERLEILAVDDGSTDGTGEELDRYAAEHPDVIHVVHQENSGGPAAPRNLGLERARGRYVFFLDADDYLGPEALERLVDTAETNRTDVVLGKAVGVGGRRMPASMYRRNQPRTDVFSSRVYWTLSALKLFRRSLIEKHGLRFDTTMATGEDQPFTALAYIHADGISVLADYDVLYCRKRDDGGNVTSRVTTTEPRVRMFSAMLSLVGAQLPPGKERDHLIYRHFSIELHRALWLLSAPRQDRAEQERLFAELHESVSTWHSKRAMRRLPAFLRLEYHLVHQGELDALLTVMRYLRTELLARGQRKLPAGRGLEPTDVLHEGGRVYARFPFFRDPRMPVPDAVFDVTGKVARTTPAGGAVAGASLTGLDIAATGWSRERAGVFRIDGRLAAGTPADTLTAHATHGSGTETSGTASHTDDEGGFRVEVPLHTAGNWRIVLRLTKDGVREETLLPAAAAPSPGRWYRGLRPWFGRALIENDTLTVRVDRVRIRRGIARRVTRANR